MSALLLLAMLQVPDTTTVQVSIPVTMPPPIVNVAPAVVTEGSLSEVHIVVQMDPEAMALAAQRAAEVVASSGGQDGTPTWARLVWMGIGTAGVIVLARGLNKIARATSDVDVDVDVEGDEITVEVPDHHHPPGHHKPKRKRGG